MALEDVHRDLGRQDGRIGALESRVGRIESDMRASLEGINTKLDRIQETMAQNKGAARNGVTVVHWLLTGLGIIAAYLSGHAGGH